MTITFVGHGYVGLVTAAVFADLGNTVWVIGHTPSKIANLRKGILPIYEPGLEEIVRRNLKAKRLFFTLAYSEAIAASSVVFIAVGTPPKANGDADLAVVFEVAKKLGKHLDDYTVVATKSTVSVGTNRQIKAIIEKVKPAQAAFDIASVPEFLREGQAISDTLHPDRIVIGRETPRAQDVLTQLHKPIDGKFLFTTIETAEMIKYTANAMLATKISFANAIAQLCERVGADGLAVLEAVGLDKRVGPRFLSAGAGFGGSCFPKDLRALIAIASDYGYNFALLKAVEDINKVAIASIAQKAKKLLKAAVAGKTIGVLGLSFKPDTDDMRDAPAIFVIETLQKDGGKVKAYDPIAMTNARRILTNVEFYKDPYTVAENCDIVIIMTEWNEFRQLNLGKIKKLMKSPILLDARNIYDPKSTRALGFTYQGVGR